MDSARFFPIFLPARVRIPALFFLFLTGIFLLHIFSGSANTNRIAQRVLAADPEVTVAFIGDQGSGSDGTAVLNLVKTADFIIHAGDFDYNYDPQAWDTSLTTILGADYPYFASVGNHDAGKWAGVGGYQEKLQQRLERISGVTCTGDLGVNSHCKFKGISFVLSGVGTRGTGHADFIRSSLSSDTNIWKICAWHKNQIAMQLGEKGNETGWDVYEACRSMGAIIATAHEHSYSRTKTLVNMQTQEPDPLWPDTATVAVGPGKTFAFVSGLGGKDMRRQIRCLPHTPPYGCNGIWAHIFTTHQTGNQQKFGALFITFNAQGDPRKAHGVFRTTDGTIIDEFTILAPDPNAAPQATPTPLQSENVSMKVLSYNIEQENDPYDYQETKTLAAYLKTHAIDIAGLQEVSLYTMNTDRLVDEPKLLEQELNAMGYPMYNQSVRYWDQDWRVLSVFSRFPLQDAQSVAGFHNRAIQRIQTVTPYGPIQIFNVHLHHTNPCKAMEELFPHVNTFPKQPTIITGDINKPIGDLITKGSAQCDSGVDAQIRQYTISCTGTSTCGGSQIDYVLVSPDSLRMDRSAWDKSIHISDHPGSIVADVTLLGAVPQSTVTPNPLAPTPTPNTQPTNTPIPQPSPTPPVSYYDVKIPLMGIKLGSDIPPIGTWLDVILRVFNGPQNQ